LAIDSAKEFFRRRGGLLLLESLARGREVGWEGDLGRIGVVLVPLFVEQLRGLTVLEVEWRKLALGLP